MSKMYVVNCTQQVQDFVYRVPESSGMRSQQIAIGGYVQLSGELNKIQIDVIVAQHARYGMVAEEEVDRTKAFIGLFYTIDRLPKLTKIYGAITHNVNVLQDRGKKNREEAAIFTSAAIENNVPNGALKQLEMSVVEERRNGREVTDEPSIAEGVRVDREHKGPPVPETRAEQRRRNARRNAA